MAFCRLPTPASQTLPQSKPRRKLRSRKHPLFQSGVIDPNGLVFAVLDAGGSMVCLSTHENDGKIDREGCTMFDIRAGEVVADHLDIRDHSD